MAHFKGLLGGLNFAQGPYPAKSKQQKNILGAIKQTMHTPPNSNTDQNVVRRTLTVIVPNYNHSHFLPRSLDSILNQSRLPDEILICDDGSADNSLEIITGYAEKWPMIRVIRNEPNKGVLFTIRRLVLEATGELVLGCAADDELCQGFIAHAMTAAETYPTLGMYSGRTIFRTPSREGVALRDEESVFGWSGQVTPEDFGAVPAWIKPHLASGISVSAVMNRQYWLEFLPLSEPLGPLSDQFERLAVAAKYGFYVIDFSGHVFYLTEGGYSRSNTPDWPIETVNRLLMMARLISHPQLKVYFPRHLRNQLSEVWSDMAMRNLHRDVARPFYEATANLYSAFDRLSMNGKLTAKAIGKLIGIARNCQLNWLKHCLLMKFKLAMG